MHSWEKDIFRNKNIVPTVSLTHSSIMRDLRREFPRAASVLNVYMRPWEFSTRVNEVFISVVAWPRTTHPLLLLEGKFRMMSIDDMLALIESVKEVVAAVEAEEDLKNASRSMGDS